MGAWALLFIRLVSCDILNLFIKCLLLWTMLELDFLRIQIHRTLQYENRFVKLIQDLNFL